MLGFKKAVILLFVLSVCLIKLPQSFADSVYLKNGRVIMGTVIEESDDRVKIDCMDMGMYSSYSKKNVKKIERDGDRIQIKDSKKPSFSGLNSVFSQSLDGIEKITAQIDLQKSWFSIPTTTGEGMFNPVFLPFVYECKGGIEDENQSLTFPCLLSFKFDLVPDNFSARHPAFIFRADSEVLSQLENSFFESGEIANYVNGWKATHAIAGEIVQTADGYKGMFIVFDKQGREVLLKRYDEAMPYFSLMGSMVKDFMEFRNQLVNDNLKKELFRPMTGDMEAVRLYGETFNVQWRSQEEWDIYEKILSIDPDFAEVRVWYANQLSWETGDKLKTHESYAKALRSNFVMTLMEQFCVSGEECRISDFENKLKYAEAMYTENPNLLDAHLRSSDKRIFIEDMNKYLQAAQKYTRMAPLIEETGWVYERYQRYDIAIPLYISAINSTYLNGVGNFASAYRNLARMFYYLGYYPEALFCINKGLQDCSEDLKQGLLCYKGLVLQELFDFDNAGVLLFSDLTQESLKKEKFTGMISLFAAKDSDSIKSLPGFPEIEKRFPVGISAYQAMIDGDPMKAVSMLAGYKFRCQDYDEAKMLLIEMIRAEAFLKTKQINQAQEHAFNAWYMAPRSRLTAYLVEKVLGSESKEYGHFVSVASFLFPKQAYWQKQEEKFSKNRTDAAEELLSMFNNLRKDFAAVPKVEKANYCFRQPPFYIEYLCLNILRNQGLGDEDKEAALDFFIEYSQAMWQTFLLQKVHDRNFFITLLQFIPEKGRQIFLNKFETATVDHSVVVKSLVYKASEYDDAGEYDKALEVLAEAEKLAPNSPFVLNCFAYTLVKAQRNDEVISFADRAIEIDPYYRQPHVNKGWALIAQEKRSEALDEFKQAIEVDPDYAQEIDDIFSDRFGLRGCEYLRQGKINTAIEDFMTALKINPDCGASYYNLACCYARINNEEEALYYLEKAINLEPREKEIAKTDKDFNLIRESDDFKNLIFSE